ncbi:MAG: hydrogenase expression/formation protein HypE [Nitrospirae bacterium]|nr:hydrogenase expression/formation protein HypE [Nitrospirota bacterium]
MKHQDEFALSCPVSFEEYPAILLGHGGGGKLMNHLIEKMFLPLFGTPLLDTRHDGTTVDLSHSKIAMTTDSYVVQPLFFPGGDIGSLAIYGTVNDLAMCGANPLYLSAGFILEEGLSMETLWRVVQSMQKAADRAGVRIITGDTKVVERGKGDGIFINTTGIGVVEHSQKIGPASVRPGDILLINGDIASHGIAIMGCREGLSFESALESDSAPLAGLTRELLSSGIHIHCMRDLTRGGLASALNEIAQSAGIKIRIDEALISVREEVRGACEILGLDPLHIANEGRFVAFIPREEAAHALSIMRSHPMGEGSGIIGEVEKGTPDGISETFPVIMRNKMGSDRIVDMLSGEQLPRIC